jgi:hypothetical protein
MEPLLIILGQVLCLYLRDSHITTGSGSIPTYVPLIFKFKLFAISRLDQDGDGIPLFRRFEWRWIYEKFFEYKFITTLSDAIICR